MLDHRQGPPGVAVDDHGHIAVPFAHRGLIDQQHRAAAAAAPLSDQSRPDVHQGAHTVPVHTVPSRHRAERHHLRVSDQPPRQTPRQRALKGRVVLQEAAFAVVAHHPAPRPHQHGAPSRHLQVADLPVAAVMHPVAAEPALRAAQPQQRGGSTLTLSAPGASSSTSSTRICGKCSRTVIASEAIGALLDR